MNRIGQEIKAIDVHFSTRTSLVASIQSLVRPLHLASFVPAFLASSRTAAARDSRLDQACWLRFNANHCNSHEERFHSWNRRPLSLVRSPVGYFRNRMTGRFIRKLLPQEIHQRSPSRMTRPVAAFSPTGAVNNEWNWIGKCWPTARYMVSKWLDTSIYCSMNERPSWVI